MRVFHSQRHLIALFSVMSLSTLLAGISHTTSSNGLSFYFLLVDHPQEVHLNCQEKTKCAGQGLRKERMKLLVDFGAECKGLLFLLKYKQTLKGLPFS